MPQGMKPTRLRWMAEIHTHQSGRQNERGCRSRGHHGNLVGRRHYLNLFVRWQAELEAHKREAARRSPEPRRREGGASGNKAKGSSGAREAALKAELDVTAQSLAASKQEAEALSTGLEKANAFIEVLHNPVLQLFSSG